MEWEFLVMVNVVAAFVVVVTGQASEWAESFLSKESLDAAWASFYCLGAIVFAPLPVNPPVYSNSPFVTL